MGFDYLALSFRLGLRKPDPRIWQTACRKLKVPPSECLFVDDQEENIAAFKKLGGIGHHYNVVDEKFLPNGQLEIERNRLLLRMFGLGMLTDRQMGYLIKITF